MARCSSDWKFGSSLTIGRGVVGLTPICGGCCWRVAVGGGTMFNEVCDSLVVSERFGGNGGAGLRAALLLIIGVCTALLGDGTNSIGSGGGGKSSSSLSASRPYPPLESFSLPFNEPSAPALSDSRRLTAAHPFVLLFASRRATSPGARLMVSVTPPVSLA